MSSDRSRVPGRPALAIGTAIVGVPAGWLALGPVGVLIALAISAVVALTPAILAYRTVKNLGPNVLTGGGHVDATCASLDLHLGAPGEEPNQ